MVSALLGYDFGHSVHIITAVAFCKIEELEANNGELFGSPFFFYYICVYTRKRTLDWLKVPDILYSHYVFLTEPSGMIIHNSKPFLVGVRPSSIFSPFLFFMV